MTISKYPKPIQAAVRRLREELGLSYAQMGIRADLDASTVWKMEQSGRASLETVAQFARAFDLDVNEWLELAGYPRIEPSLTDAVRAVATYDPDANRPVTPQAFGGQRLAVDRDRIREAIRKLEIMDRQAAAEEEAGGGE